MKKTLLSISAILLLSGCSGKLYTIINPDLPRDGTTKKIEGILTHNTINVIELYNTTVLIDKSSGNQIGTAESGACIPEKKMKFSTRTDYSNPNIIVYEAGLFETNKFGISLEKGVLKAVNTESNPSAALPNIASIMPFFRAPKIDKLITGKPLCNASLKLIGVFKAPAIKSFRDMQNL